MATKKHSKTETKSARSKSNTSDTKKSNSTKKNQPKKNIINKDESVEETIQIISNQEDENTGSISVIDVEKIEPVEQKIEVEVLDNNSDLIESITVYAELPKPNNAEDIVSVDNDTTTESKEESVNTETEYSETPLDLEKTFVCKKGSSFMEGSVLISVDDTNIKRANETSFVISGNINGTTPFQVPFECHDKEEADYFFNELLEYEKNPENFIKGENNTNQDAGTLESKNYDGVTVDSGNIDDLINSLNNSTESVGGGNEANATVPNTVSSPMDMSSILNSNMLGQMSVYGKSIADHINGSFQALHWGGMPIAMANDFLNSCSKDYSYKFIKEPKGYSLIVSKDNFDVRIPESTSEFLKISD